MEMSRLEDQLVDMVQSVAKVDVSVGPGTDATTPQEAYTEAVEAAEPATAGSSGGAEAVAEPTGSYVDSPTLLLGSSTGGPTVVERVMAELPLEADLRVLIVQHMPDGFTGRFAERLDGRSDYDVREATDGARIGGGEALVAAGGKHMDVTNYARGRLRVALTEAPPENSVRPAVDVTMRTAADCITDPMVAVILTGMGTDGADGVRAVSRAGGHVIAQNEASSAVYGMPKRAVETGVVDDELALESITEAVLDALTEA